MILIFIAVVAVTVVLVVDYKPESTETIRWPANAES